MRKFYLAFMFILPSIAIFGQCPAVSEFSENFDASAEMPECWSTLRVNPPASSFAVVQVQTNAANSYSPSNSVRMFNQLGGEADFYLISPKVDNLADGTHQLRFVFRGQPNTDNLDAIIEVGTMTDPEDGDSFTLVETLEDNTGVFTEYTVVFDESSTDEYLAIKADFEVTFRNIFFDDVSWEAVPSCPKPTDLVVNNLGSTSADLSWTAGGSETEWEIRYGVAGFDIDTEGITLIDSDDLGESVDELLIGTDYEFYVKAICDVDDESVWSFAGSFTTFCDVYPLNYMQDFSSFVPNCWEEADAGNPTSGPGSFGSANWTNSNFLNNVDNGPATKIILYASSVSDWLISPEIELSTMAELSFDAGFTLLNSQTTPDSLGSDDQVQVLITTDAGSTWEALITYSNETGFPDSSGVTEVIDLSAYSGTVQFGIWATDGAISDTPDTYDVFFDNFAVSEVVCPAVSEFSESFDASSDMPECWSTLRVNPPASPFAVVQVQTNAANSYSPSNSIRMFNQLGADAEFYLISPKVNNLADGTHQLRFVFRGQPNADNLDAIIEVGTITDPENGDTFTSVETLADNDGTFVEYTVVFDESSTDQYVAIKANFEVTFRNIHFDDVTWEAVPSCPKPTSLEALNLSSTSADLSWTAGGSEMEWEVVYGAPGFDPETEGTTVMDTDDLGVSLEDLMIGTTYEFYVKAICGEDDESVWSFAGMFTTLCDVYPLDYMQDFSTFVPNCWVEADAGNPSTGPSDIGNGIWTTANFLNNADNGPATKIILYGSIVSDWLISPEIDLSVNSELSYDAGITILNSQIGPDSLGADDLIQVVISADNGSTWEVLKSYSNADGIPPATGVTEIIDLSAYSGTVQFAFYATDGSMSDTPATYDVFFDNFHVYAVEVPCVDPSDIAVADITFESAMVTWTENGEADTWEVKFGLEGFDLETEGTVETANGSAAHNLLDLDADTFYDVYVRAVCDETTTSEWVGPVAFTTLVSGMEDIVIDGFNFYPNPAVNQVSISANEIIEDVVIYSAVGKVHSQTLINGRNGQIDVSSLSSGVYILTVSTQDKTQTVKFVKK